MLISLLVTLS